MLTPLLILLAISLIPLGDDNNGRSSIPIVTYALIAINIGVFIFLQAAGSNQAFTYGYSVIPRAIGSGHPLVGLAGAIPGAASPSPIYFTLLTAMFMHGGWMHIGGNMLYLWIFGDNVEDAMGHAKFLIFYLVCGLIATLTYIAFNLNSVVPSLGASGAIAGVLGAYLLMYPTRKVRVLIGYFGVIELPAFLVIGGWGALQLLNGAGAIAHTAQTAGDGVAYMAHVGGLAAGLLLCRLFTGPKRSTGRNDYAQRR